MNVILKCGERGPGAETDLEPKNNTCSRGRVGGPLGTECLWQGTWAGVSRLSFVPGFDRVLGGFVLSLSFMFDFGRLAAAVVSCLRFW